MNNKEKKISKYIDRLNNEKKPREHEKYIADSEYEELMGVVRLLKSTKEPDYPGEEEIAGRRTSVLEVTPQGGDTYRLWIDKETDMPLQKQSPKVNALQYTATYINIEFTEAIPKELITYEVPEGYEVTETDTEQFVGDMEEAVHVAGFSQQEAGGAFEPDSAAILGKVNDSAPKFWPVRLPEI